MITQVRDASQQAAAAYRGLRDVAATFFEDAKAVLVKAEFAVDRFAMGESE